MVWFGGGGMSRQEQLLLLLLLLHTVSAPWFWTCLIASSLIAIDPQGHLVDFFPLPLLLHSIGILYGVCTPPLVISTISAFLAAEEAGTWSTKSTDSHIGNSEIEIVVCLHYLVVDSVALECVRAFVKNSGMARTHVI